MSNEKIKVITGKVRFSYANVWEAKSINGSEEKFSVCLIIPKSDVTTINNIKSAIKEAARIGKNKLGEMLESEIMSILHDGDIERCDDEVYKNSYFINASSKIKPQIVDRKVKAIVDKSDFYSGCYGKASIYFFAYNNEKKGIGCGLGNLQKLSDGSLLSSRASAEDEFTASEEDDEFLS